MSQLLGNRFVITGLVALILLIPLNMIDDLATEREARHRDVIAQIADSSSAGQTLLGPVLVVPCTRTSTELVWKEGFSARLPELQESSCEQFILPRSVSFNTRLDTEERSRGIYAALLFQSDVAIRAEFDIPANFGIVAGADRIETGEPYLALGLSDIRGILSTPEISTADSTWRFKPGSRLAALGSGVHAQLSDLQAGQSLALNINLRLLGMNQLTFVPTGQDNHISMISTWPHPGFIGAHLPRHHDIHAEGFSANWETSHFTTDFATLLKRHYLDTRLDPALTASAFGVQLTEPVDLYRQTDRAIKYGFLFILMTFSLLLVTEALYTLNIHPVQYSMVGLALALFFLLLLSLGEHLGFLTAYLIASSACISLLGYYIAGLVHNVRLGLWFAGGLATLYALIYALLTAEDFSLLAGSIFIFALLTAVMVLTRHVDWARLSPVRNEDMPREPAHPGPSDKSAS